MAAPTIIKKNGKFSVTHNGKIIVKDFLSEINLSKEQINRINECIADLKSALIANIVYHDKVRCLNVVGLGVTYTTLSGRTLTHNGTFLEEYDIVVDEKTLSKLSNFLKSILKSNRICMEDFLKSSYIRNLPPLVDFRKRSKEIIKDINGQLKSFTNNEMNFFVEKYESILNK